MFQLFNDNASIAPRTYSLRGYKSKRRVGIGKILLYSLYIIVTLLVLGIMALSAYSMI